MTGAAASADDAAQVLDRARVAAWLDRCADARTSTGPGRFDDTLGDLAALGLPPGSVVMIAMSGSLHMVEVYLATLLTGLVPLAVAPSTPSARIRGLARHFAVAALVGPRLEPGLHGPHPVRRAGPAQAVVLDGGRPRHRPGEVLIATSGTSSMFSACLHRVDSLLRNAGRHAASVALTGSDTVLVSLPLYYSYALVAQMLAAYLTGARLVVAGPPFVPSSYAAALRRHDVTHSSVTPSIVRRLLVSLDELPTGLRALTVGGDRLGPDAVAALLRMRPGGELYVTYGLSEAGPRVSTLAAHAEPSHRFASVGRPLPGVRTALRPPLAPDGTGELLVTSDTVLLAKIGQTGPPPRGTLVAPGTIATTDLFRIDDGYLYFQGRASDFVLVRGEKVSLQTVRQAVHTLPGVVHCAPVLSVADDGEVALDIDVTVTDPRLETGPAIRRALRSVLLPAERPRSIRVTAADPAVFRK